MTDTERAEIRATVEAAKARGWISEPKPEDQPPSVFEERYNNIILTVTQAVRDFVDAWDGTEFWSGDVVDWIRLNRELRTAGHANVGTALKRLVKEGLLTVRDSAPKEDYSKTGNRRLYRRVRR